MVPLFSKAAIGSRGHGSLMDYNRSSASEGPFVAIKSEWNSQHTLLCRTIQEHLLIQSHWG